MFQDVTRISIVNYALKCIFSNALSYIYSILLYLLSPISCQHHQCRWPTRSPSPDTMTYSLAVREHGAWGVITLQWRHNEHYGVSNHLIVYPTVHLNADQRKHQISALRAFVGEIHRWPVNSPHNGPVARKMFPFDDVIMNAIWLCHITGQ